MTKKLLKFLSFWFINFVFCGVVSSLLQLHLRQWLLLVLIMTLATFVIVLWANFWENRQQQELTVMEKRMADTVAGETPRGVLAEPGSPYYALIKQFNVMQHQIEQARQTAQRDVTNYRSLLAS